MKQVQRWLHRSSMWGTFASPVVVLSSGPKQAVVRLLHKTRFSGEDLPRGTIKRGVPIEALSDEPRSYAYVSKGGGVYVPPKAPKPKRRKGPMPKRIQLSRAKGWKKPEGAVVVSRPSKWGNPYKLSQYQIALGDGSPAPFDPQHARTMAARDFEMALLCDNLDYSVADVKRELAGKALCCWCPLPKRGEEDHCHAAILIEVANG